MIRDVFDYLRYSECGLSFADSIIPSYIKKIKLYMPISFLLGHTSRGFDSKSEYLFIGGKYKDIIKCVGNNNVIIAGSLKELLTSLWFRSKFYDVTHILRIIIDTYTSGSEEKIDIIIKKLSEDLKKSSISMVLVINDSLPLERVFIKAAKLSSIPTICIQHGLFSENGGVINDGKYADVMLAYDEYQKNVLYNTGARNVKIFGYFKNVKRKNKSNKKIVCILGQPWADYYPDKKDAYIKSLKLMIGAIELHSFQWIYKPHPSESHRGYDCVIKDRKFNGKLEKAFEKYDFFISLTSTALLEATLYGKVAIQIHDELFGFERFDQHGYAYTLPIVQINSIGVFLNNPKPIKNEVKVSDLKGRFFNIINDGLVR